MSSKQVSLLLVTGSLAVLIAASTGWVMSRPDFTPSHQQKRPSISRTAVDLTYIHMIGVQHGWALDSNWHILRTTDGGRQWSPAGPPGYRPPAVTSTTFVNRYEAFGTVGSNGRTTTVWRTQDGGRRWTRQTIHTPFQEVLMTTPYFLSSWVGWLLLGGVPGMASQPEAIYQTTDGGDRWRLVHYYPMNDLTGLVFANRQTGFSLGFHL